MLLLRPEAEVTLVMFEDATGLHLQTRFVWTMQQEFRQPSVAIASDTAPSRGGRHSQNPGVRMPGRVQLRQRPKEKD